MINFKKLLCSHDYEYKGAYYRISADYYNSCCYNILYVFKCKKCGNITKKCFESILLYEEIPEFVFKTKTELYNKILRE